MTTSLPPPALIQKISKALLHFFRGDLPHDDHLVYMGLEAEEAEGEMGEGRLEKPMAQPAEVQIIIIVIVIVISMKPIMIYDT